MEIIKWFEKTVLIERYILIWGILSFMFFSSLITYFIMR